MVLGPDFHFVEGIGEVGVAELIEADRLGVVGVDRDQRDALVLVVGVHLLDAGFVCLGGRAVIAGEEDDEDFGRVVVVEGVVFPVDAGEVEVRSGGVDGEWGDVGREGEGGENDDQREREGEAGHGPPGCWSEDSTAGGEVRALGREATKRGANEKGAGPKTRTSVSIRKPLRALRLQPAQFHRSS